MVTRRKPAEAEAPEEPEHEPEDKGGGDVDRESLIDEIISRLKAEGLVSGGGGDGLDGDGDAVPDRPRTQAEQEVFAEDAVRRALSRIGAERDLEDVKAQVAALKEKPPVQQSWLNKLMWGKAE